MSSHRRSASVTCQFLLLLLSVLSVAASAQNSPSDNDPLVDLATVDSTILVELRYATPRNITGRALYPAGSRCIVRRRVAEALKVAQSQLRPQGYRLKIWDAYRPEAAQQALWELSKNPSFVASPGTNRSLHMRGVAVDATLVDASGKELRMPTDFDDFSPAAAMHYRGGDPVIARNLSTLQKAMAQGGFVGMRTEWWHFIGKHWQSSKAVHVDSLLPGKDGFWSTTAPPSAVGSAPRPATAIIGDPPPPSPPK